MRKIVAVLLSSTFIAFIVYYVNLGSILTSIRGMDVKTLAGCLALIVLNLFAVAFRLQRILRHFGSKTPYFVAFHASLSGLMAGLFLINVVGSVLGRQVVLRAVGVSAALSTFVSGYERLVLAIIGGVLAFWGGGLLAGGHLVDDLFKGLPIIPMIIALALIGLLVLFTARSSFERDIMRRLRNPRRIVEVSEIFAISAFSQVLNIYIYTMLLSSMGFELPLWKTMAAAAMVSFAASLPISVNGWGVREISAIYAFGLLGVSTSSATALSITVGLLNTLVVVISAPAFTLSRRVFAASISRYRTATTSDQSSDFPEIFSRDQLDFQKISGFTIGICLPILLYFQFPVNVSGTTLTINFGDVFALLALGMLASQISLGVTLDFRLSRGVLLWLALVSIAVYLSLVVGLLRYGAIPWAIGNRGIGWVVVLGYFGSGALFAGEFGRKGIRRMVEVLLLTAATVATVHLFHRAAYSFAWTLLPPSPNFEGFSANRNAFAFQLLVTFGLAVCYLLPNRRVEWKLQGLAMAILVFATLATNSLTSYVCIVCLTIVIATARKGLLLRCCTVAALGVVLYVSLPLIFNLLNFRYTSLPSLVEKFPSTAGGPGAAAVGPGAGGVGGIFGELPINRMVGNADSSVTERLESLHGGFVLWLSHPIFGGGLGAFISTQISKTGVPLVIHSTYVWIVAEMGVVGLLLIGWIPSMQIRRLWSNWWRRPKQLIGGFGRNDSALFLLIMIFCVFSLAHEIAYQRIFWFALGALLAEPGRMSLAGLRSRMYVKRNDGLKDGNAERPIS